MTVVVPGAVWSEKQKRWRVNAQKAGVRKSFYSPKPGRVGQREAEAKAGQWLSEGILADATFQTAWDAFLATKKPPYRKQDTYARLESQGRIWLLPALQRKKLSSIVPQDWQRILDDMAVKGLAKRSIINVRASITGFCKWARFMQHWPVEVPMYLTVASTAPAGRKVSLQPNDLRTLFTVGTETVKGVTRHSELIDAFRLIVLLGCRRGELCGMKWADIQDNVWKVSRSVDRFQNVTTPKTEAAVRYIPLNTRAKVILASREQEKEGPYVFHDELGEPLDSNRLYKRWVYYAKCHGIKGSLHELRHTYISLMKADMPEPLLKAVVGHTVKMDTYGVYGHTVEGDMQRINVISDSVFNTILKKQ